jgi:hypothetical protein
MFIDSGIAVSSGPSCSSLLASEKSAALPGSVLS